MATNSTDTILQDQFMKIPANTSAARPTTGLVGGEFRKNNTTGGIEFYNEILDEWISLGVIDGSSPASAFSSTSQIANFGYTGQQTLWTTFGGRTSGTQVKVDFSMPNGPWIILGFDLGSPAGYNTTAGGNAYRSVAGFGGTDSNNLISNATREGRSVNIGLGLGNYKWYRNFGDIFTGSSLTSITGYGFAGNASTYGPSYGPYTINYYNFATQSNLTSTEKSAAQDWVQNLSPYTPMAFMEMDSDAADDTDAWNSQSISGTSGHQVWIRDKDNVWMRGTVTVATPSDHGTAYTWTDSTFNAWLLDGAGSYVNSSQVTAAQNAGGFASLSRKLCMPNQYYFVSQTGGGGLWGTPASKVSDQGWTTSWNGSSYNIKDNRRFFLVKG